MNSEERLIPATFELTDISETKIEGTPRIMFGKNYPKEFPIVMTIKEFIERCKDNVN